MKEKLKHREAFEFFYSLGGEASEKNARKVAEKYQVSERTIWRWYKQFNWRERVEQRDIENAKKLKAKTDRAIVNSKADYRALIKKTVDLYKKRLEEGKIIINRPQDLDTLIKADLTLMGESTNDIEIKVKLPKDLEEQDADS